MKRAGLIAFALCAGVGLRAAADKTITILSANSTVVRMEFYPQPGGSVRATVCGRSTLSDGTTATQATCHDTTLPPGNAIATSVNNLASGSALTFWKNQEGL